MNEIKTSITCASKSQQPLLIYGMDMTIKLFLVGPPSSANFADEGENSSQQRGSLPVPQVPIRLMNIWYGRPDWIMAPLPS